MAERGIVLVPTLSTFYDLAERFAADFAPRLVEQAKRQTEDAALTPRRRPRRPGVILAMGYDSGPPGASANELVRMAEAGLGAADAIRAATQGSACALGLTDVGTVEVGRVADLLVVDGDPLDRPGIFLEPERIRLVIQAGRVVGGTRTAPSDIRP